MFATQDNNQWIMITRLRREIAAVRRMPCDKAQEAIDDSLSDSLEYPAQPILLHFGIPLAKRSRLHKSSGRAL